MDDSDGIPDGPTKCAMLNSLLGNVARLGGADYSRLLSICGARGCVRDDACLSKTQVMKDHVHAC